MQEEDDVAMPENCKPQGTIFDLFEYIRKRPRRIQEIFRNTTSLKTLCTSCALRLSTPYLVKNFLRSAWAFSNQITIICIQRGQEKALFSDTQTSAKLKKVSVSKVKNPHRFHSLDKRRFYSLFPLLTLQCMSVGNKKLPDQDSNQGPTG